jgi:predicted nuclease with TOPRIM domain
MVRSGAPVFVKINDYKDILDVLDLIKDRLGEAKRTLADLNELKNDEDAELELWSGTLNEIEKKLEDIDRSLFEPESTY